MTSDPTSGGSAELRQFESAYSRSNDQTMANHPGNAAYREIFVRQMLIAMQQVLSCTGAEQASQETHSEAQLPAVCYVALNLKMLGRLLNLTELERQWLQWSYCWSRSTDVEWPDERMFNRNAALEKLSILWGVPLEMISVTASPNRLRTLHLLEPFDSSGTYQLFGAWLHATEHFLQLVERPHRSHANLLNAMLSQKTSWMLEKYNEVPEAVFYGCMPRLVADSHLCDRRSESLSAVHIAALVGWFSDLTMANDRFDVLAGHVSVTSVRNALQLEMLRCCQLKRPFTEYAVLKVLFEMSHWG